MTLRVLIADDEPLALDGLHLALSDIDDLKVVARCRNGSEAIRGLREHRPDLAILDVAMPGLTGFDVVQSLDPETIPAIIFLTAHDEFALRAFRVDASDYLLKPVDDHDLRAAIEKVRRQIRLQATAARLESASSEHGNKVAAAPTDRIVVRTSGRVYFVEPGEISWLEACGDYVQVHSGERTHMLRASLRGITEKLRKYGFCRVHRSATVNIGYVRELIATENGDHRLVLNDGTYVRLSRTFRDDLFAAMSGEEVS